MIKQSVLNLGENFFSQTLLLLFPVLIFSSSLEFALLIGTLSLFLIYFSSFLFLSLRTHLTRNFYFAFLLSLSVFCSTLVSTFSYYFYPKIFEENAYLVNLYFVSLLCWQKYPLRSRSLKVRDLNQQVLPSLLSVCLLVWLSALLREGLGTGCLSFFHTTLTLFPAEWTLPILKTNIGALASTFLSAYFLGLKPQNYKEHIPLCASLSSPPKKNLKQSIAEKASQLEKLLNSSDFSK